VCDGGFLIDLSGMRSIRVDPEARVAHVEPGATPGDFDSGGAQGIVEALLEGGKT
jgi:hypothetical protein